MGCEKPMSYEIEINIENELGVFEPRDDVAGHILIKAEEDTEIDGCVLWLYGLTKTRWNVQSENRITRPGSLASGINLLRSTSNFNRLNNAANSYTADNKFCKLLSSASNALKQTAASKPLDYSSIRLPLSTCCTDQGYLSDTHYKSSCDYNHSSYILDREVGLAARIGGSWISASGSFNSSLDARSSTKSFHSAGKFDSPSRTSNFNDFSHRSSQQFTTKDTLYDSACIPNFCLEQWKKIFELDTDKKKCIYHGDLQLIYKSKVDLLKQYQHVLSSKSDQSTRNSITEIVKNIRHKDDDNLNVNCDGNESPNEVPSFDEKTNRSGLQQQHSISKRYYELLNNMNDKSLTSGDRNAKLKPKFILTRGIHVFDFEFQLPADLPGSFELPTNCLAGGASASITYAVRLEICNNRLKMRHIQQREIIVFRPLELIHFPRLRDRITLHREFVSLGCCSNPGGLILCDLAVNKTGFVPGETIIPQIHITNRSSQAIQTVHLTFAQTVFLKGANNQNHIEVLRIFATRLNAQPTVLGFDLFEQLDMNSLGGLFSPSNSFSSRSSTNRVDRIQQQQHRQFDMKQKNCRNTNSHSNQRQKSRRRHQNHHSSSAPIVAVSGQGGKAYFTDLIHVPPLPTSGLFGRQNLIHVEYSLILRLRMQGDKEGKHDHCMQIPITIGSDPTRETSFIGNSEVVPCYASFNFASGDIVEYDPLNQNNSTRMTPVYRYFKPKPMEQTANKSNITFSSDSPVNSSSIKSLQNTSKSSPSILKPTGTSSTSTNTGTGNSTNISGENRQYSLKSNKSLYCTEHSQKSPRHQQQVKQQLSSLVYSPDDAVVASFTTLYNSDGAKSDTCSYNQILNKKHKQVSSYKLRRQNNFQELTPHKTHISLSAGVITNPINLDTRSPELCLSNQQFFDDGDVTLSNMTNSADDNVISTSFRSNKLNKDNALNFSFSKDQSQIIHQPIQHLKYLDGNERACLSSGLREHHHPHDSSVCSKYVENSSLEYKCKSQTNIPLRQYSFGLFSDERSSFDDREDCRNQRHQSNEYCQQYSSELVRPKQIHYGVDDDEENNEEEEDEDDNIPYESNNDDVTSDEMNKYTLKTNHFYLTPNDNSEGCTGRLLNPDNLSRSRSTSSSNFSQNEEEEEYDDDLDDDLNNTCEEENAMGNHEDDILAADKEGESDKNYTDQQQKQNQQNLQQHRLKTYQDESLSQASLNLNHTPSDIKELYFKVQQISDQKNISINYKFKQSKNIHDAYWNSPRVAPIAGRKAETEGFWTYGHGNASQNKETSA